MKKVQNVTKITLTFLEITETLLKTSFRFFYYLFLIFSIFQDFQKILINLKSFQNIFKTVPTFFQGFPYCVFLENIAHSCETITQLVLILIYETFSISNFPHFKTKAQKQLGKLNIIYQKEQTILISRYKFQTN